MPLYPPTTSTAPHRHHHAVAHPTGHPDAIPCRSDRADSALIRAVRLGDMGAVEALYVRHHEAVLRAGRGSRAGLGLDGDGTKAGLQGCPASGPPPESGRLIPPSLNASRDVVSSGSFNSRMSDSELLGSRCELCCYSTHYGPQT
jgi:hypothetical protein